MDDYSLDKWFNYCSNSSSLYELFERVVARYGSATMISFENGNGICNVAYSEAYKIIEGFAGYLSGLNLREKKIGVVGTMCPQWVYSFFAIMKLGGTVIPLPTDITAEMLISEIAFLGIESVICTDELSERCSKSCDNVIPFSIILEVSAEGYSTYTVKKHITSTAMIVLTSGTTSLSKSVTLTHKNIISDLSHCILMLGKKFAIPGEKVLSFLPPWHMFQITCMILELFYGLEICLTQNTVNAFRMFKPHYFIAVPEILEGINKKFTNSIFYKNALLHRISSTRIIKNIIRTKFFGGKLKVIVCGAASTNTRLIDDFMKMGISVICGYGMTECSPVISVNSLEANRIGSVGCVNRDQYCEVKLQGTEVLVRGDIVFNEYYKDKKSTSELFDNGWLCTGDLGYIDDDGFLFITGRKKNLIILSDGNNISPEFIESCLRAEDEICDALVYAKRVSKATLLCADVILSQSEKLSNDSEQLKKILYRVNSRLPKFSHLSQINIVKDDFKKTSLGKTVRYNSLQNENSHEKSCTN